MLCKVKRCCCCLPLRPGLMGFGYFKLVITYIHIAVVICRIDDFFLDKKKWNPVNYILLSLGLGSSIIDFIFTVIMLFGLHKRSLGFMDSYYRYNQVMLVIQLVVTAFLLPLITHRAASGSSAEAAIIFIAILAVAGVVIAIQIYYVILVGSVISDFKANKRKQQQQEKNNIVGKTESSRVSEQDETVIAVHTAKPQEIVEVCEKTEFNVKQDKARDDKTVSSIDLAQENEDKGANNVQEV